MSLRKGQQRWWLGWLPSRLLPSRTSHWHLFRASHWYLQHDEHAVISKVSVHVRSEVIEQLLDDRQRRTLPVIINSTLKALFKGKEISLRVAGFRQTIGVEEHHISGSDVHPTFSRDGAVLKERQRWPRWYLQRFHHTTPDSQWCRMPG